jgi:hypothetical protein
MVNPALSGAGLDAPGVSLPQRQVSRLLDFLS